MSWAIEVNCEKYPIPVLDTLQIGANRFSFYTKIPNLIIK